MTSHIASKVYQPTSKNHPKGGFLYDLFLSIKSPDAVAQSGVSVDKEQAALPVLAV